MNETAKRMSYLFYCRYFKKYQIVIPNLYMDWMGGEMDLFCLRSSGFIDEIEIKRTVDDFKKDFKKIVKVDLGGTSLYPNRAHKYEKRKKHEEIEAKRGQANRFSFYVPESIVDKIVIPEYAGLYVLREKGYVVEVKGAPLLHRQKVTIEKKYQIARKMCFRYWDIQKGLQNK